MGCNIASVVFESHSSWYEMGLKGLHRQEGMYFPHLVSDKDYQPHHHLDT